MFTGIIEEIGEIKSFQCNTVLEVSCHKILEDVKLVQKALDKLEFEIVRPMCEKFDIPFVNEESYGGERYYLDVEGIEERLEQ